MLKQEFCTSGMLVLQNLLHCRTLELIDIATEEKQNYVLLRPLVKGQMNQNLDIFSFESNVFIKYKRNIF